ncbi:MAG: TRAP transporter large permease [Deltaproteobacteria bacterium]|nr:TRAP transporter large permease [Deltaproteobacteria bacterium]
MVQPAWILSVGFGVLMVLGVPFGFALVLTTILVVVTADIDGMLLAQTLIAGTQSFSLLAIPFFMLAGEIMSAGGLSARLVNVASVFVRHLRGGLGQVTILAAVVFAAISGSAPATTAAIGSIMIPAMAARGYDRAFAAALAVSAGVLGPMIPPSIAGVIWGVVAEQSIARLFLSTVVPGLAIAAGLLVICWWQARKQGIPLEPRASRAEILQALRDGKWALLTPVIVLGGIYGGAFTPTEAAVVSCVYGLFVGFVVERRLSLRELPGIVVSAMRVTTIVMFIIAASGGFGFLVAQEQVAAKGAAWLATHLEEKWLMLLVLNLAFFVVAAVMDEIAIMVIFGPMLMAIASRFGLDPIHFGAMIVTNVSIGMAAPPIGYCLFVGMAISNLPLGRIARAIWPQVAWMLVVLFLTTYVPAFSLGIQALLGRH